MNWYIINIKDNYFCDFFDSFQELSQLNCFIPKTERYIRNKEDRSRLYLPKPLFPFYIFIESDLSGEVFYNKMVEMKQHWDFDVVGIEKGSVKPLDSSKKAFLESLMDENYTIVHSVGDIVNSVLRVYEGPMQGKEEEVLKINRHKRMAILKEKILDKHIIVSLEVPHKS